MFKIYSLQDGWGGSSQPWDDTEDNSAPGWGGPSTSDSDDEY